MNQEQLIQDLKDRVQGCDNALARGNPDSDYFEGKKFAFEVVLELLGEQT